MKKGELWLVEFPFTGGREQAKTRPAIIIADVHPEIVLVIPMTSNLQTLRFKNTLSVHPNEINGLAAESVALLFQLTAVDKRRLVKNLGILSSNLLSKVDEVLKVILGF